MLSTLSRRRIRIDSELPNTAAMLADRITTRVCEHSGFCIYDEALSLVWIYSSVIDLLR